MKKTLLAACLAAMFPAAVHAQSAVTLYGIIDEGLSYTSNAATANATGGVSGHSAIRLLSGVMQQSRWGMRGAEDLGGVRRLCEWTVGAWRGVPRRGQSQHVVLWQYR
jgi:predicted porin